MKLQTEGSESYVWLGSLPNMECSGCQKLRKEVEDLRSMLMSNSLRQTDDDDVRCYSTRISERKQMEIDKILLDAHRKAETFQEAHEKVMNTSEFSINSVHFYLCLEGIIKEITCIKNETNVAKNIL